MISSFFGKTKPINYIVLLAFVFIFYLLVHFSIFDRSYSPIQLFQQLVVLSVLSFSYFVLNFIVKRNKITAPHSFTLLFFTLLIVVFPETLIDANGILCSFFLLISMRRLISLRSLKNIRPKLFDATIWIIVASLFYDWAVVCLFLVYMAIYIYEPKNFRNWLVPIAGIFTVFMITYCMLVLGAHTQFLWEHYTFEYSFNRNYFLNWNNSTKLVLYVLGISVVGLLSFIKLGKAGMGKVATMRLIAMLFILGLVLKVLLSSKNVFPIMVTFFPASVFLAKYVESIKKPNIKEIVLLLSIFIPFMAFFIGLILN